jgi:hypothetical protein
METQAQKKSPISSKELDELTKLAVDVHDLNVTEKKYAIQVTDGVDNTLKLYEQILYFQQIETSGKSFFCSGYVRKIIEKILITAFNLMDKSGNDIVQFFISNDFKFANKDKNNNIWIYSLQENMEDEKDLQKECESLKKIEELPEHILCTANYQDMVKEILMVSLRLAEKSEIDITQFFTQIQVEKILGFALKGFITKDRVEQTLNSQSAYSKNLRLNDLGLPMHLLEVEVADLVERAKAGEQVFPKYERVKYGDPVAYLKEYYGKYLKKYNTENEDFLYQFQLQAIDPKFRNNLRMYLSNHGQDINDFVPKISMKSDMEARKIVEAGIHNLDKSVYKINNLAFSRKLRAG